jgi:sulfotransferase
MKKQLYFLSGVPRSGSTVLAAILNQNPLTHVSTTSGLVGILHTLATTWHTSPILNINDQSRSRLAQTMRGIIDAFYEEIDKPIVIDKSRGWPISMIMQGMVDVLGYQPRIIATVRSIPDCAASFVRIAKPESLDDFIYSGQLMEHLQKSYTALADGYKTTPENFLFVEYEDLIANPKSQLARVHSFLNLPDFDYDLNNIDGSSVSENDEELHGAIGMHDVKPVLKAQHKEDPKDLLKHHYANFCQPEFWLDTPRTILKVQDLD